MRTDRRAEPSPILAAARRHIVQGALNNGVRFALWPDDTDSVATVHVWVRAGSGVEQRGATGLAHMLEHLMFRGTSAVPDGVFDARMEALGAQINAATWVDYTCYTTTAPPEAIGEVIALEADRFGGLDLTEEVFAAERSVVANERRQVIDSVPEARLGEHLHHLAFGEGPYGHPTIGWAEDIEGYTREAVLGFLERWYAPGELLVVVVGAFAPAAVVEHLEATFGGLSAGPEGERRRGSRFIGAGVHELRVPVPTPRVHVAWPAPGRGEPGWATWALLEAILGGGDGSRLPMRLEVDEPLVLDVGTHLYPHAMEQLMEVDLTVRLGVDPERVLGALDEALEALATDGPTEEEVLAASRRLRMLDAGALAPTAGRASRMGESWVTFGDAGTDFGLVDEMRQVRGEDVRALAGRLCEGLPRLVLHGVPTGEEDA
ncbi:MAG: insulinase family protein [Deltaproteobacteria bacterium]|nr:MAG: insulinase family protein [Deltaproteobacteria bacterium]